LKTHVKGTKLLDGRDVHFHNLKEQSQHWRN